MILYESDRATVHLGDARDVLAEIPKESTDLIVVDPPYGVEWQSSRRSEAFDVLVGDRPDEAAGVREILEACVRIVGQNRHLYVFGPPELVEGLKTSKPVSLIWDKGAMTAGDLNSGWGAQHEPVSFLVSKFRHAGKAGLDNALPARIRKGSIIRAGKRTGRTVRHPTEKPVSLLSEFVESSSRFGDLVVDPCAGIGSTGVAAIVRGRRTLLIEVEQRWAEIAVERIRKAERIADAIAAL